MVAYGDVPIHPAIRSRFVEAVNGLRMHVLEAGEPAAPLLLLLHGFPELAYSWRKVIVPLAEAGYYVIAPDQRGYGRTSGWTADYDGELAPFRLLNIVQDALALVHRLGRRSAAAVIGHDFGAPVAAYCGLVRPDVFPAVAMMSAPFGGPPALDAGIRPQGLADPGLPQALAALPRPRKHYHWYYASREANADMQHAPQGVHNFLRAYYHHKSADWPDNRPEPLKDWSAAELARLPTYYVMELGETMAQTVGKEMPSRTAIAGCRWLPEEELRVYSAEYARTGFQGGLQWYRCGITPRFLSELALFHGRAIEMPACFISGRSDWGTYQKPGEFERMQSSACARLIGCRLVEGAGHWVQQEQPEAVTRALLEFLRSLEG